MKSKRLRSNHKKIKLSDTITLRLDSYVEGSRFIDAQVMLNENNRAKLKAKAAKGIKPRNRNKKYVTALNCLLANLVESVLQELPLAIGHREDFYKKKKRRNPNQISAYVMTATLKQLTDKNVGLVQIFRRGFHDRSGRKESMLSLYVPTASFDLFKGMATKGGNQLFVRRLKLADQLTPTVVVYESAENERRIYYDVDFDRPGVVETVRVLTDLSNVLKQTQFKVRGVSIEAPTFYRSFSPDYTKHGRIYSEGGSFQNWKKKFVKDLLIDGQPTVELDFSSTHTAIAYAIKSCPMPSKDVYILNSLSPIEDPILKRNLGKAFTNIMLNADSRTTAAQAIGKAFADQGIKYRADLGISIPEVMEEITERHQAIGKYFFTGAGLYLMKVESDICLEVIDKFTQLKKPIIPKHDSFIVKSEDEELLRQTMIQAWVQVMAKIRVGNGELQPPNISKKKDDSLF